MASKGASQRALLAGVRRHCMCRRLARAKSLFDNGFGSAERCCLAQNGSNLLRERYVTNGLHALSLPLVHSLFARIHRCLQDN